jgi:hypothetical protein
MSTVSVTARMLRPRPAATYRPKVPSADTPPDREREILDRFATSGERVIALVRGWDRWDYPIWDVRIGDWTVAQVLQHLIAVEWHVLNARLDSLDADTEPHWSWAEPGPAEGIGDGSISAAAVVFAASREATVDRLRAMPPEAWRRTGVHATYGRLDIAGLLEVMLEHDEAHLAELERLA